MIKQFLYLFAVQKYCFSENLSKNVVVFSSDDAGDATPLPGICMAGDSLHKQINWMLYKRKQRTSVEYFFSYVNFLNEYNAKVL